MFGWFRPTCPCDPEAKRWVEQRLRWLTRQFGLHVLLEAPVVLPTEEFFPDRWDGSPEAVRLLFDRVCGHMGVRPNAVRLELFTDKPLYGATGFAAAQWQDGEESWQKPTIRIERTNLLGRPADLIGTMAHELAHQRLLAEHRAEADAFDNELLTDLTAVYHGFGVFLANNTNRSTGQLGTWPGTKLYRPEYLSEPMLGYAMAHVAWFRDEDWPAWAKHLGWVRRSVFKQGLRYLQKTGDSTFQPVRLARS